MKSSKLLATLGLIVFISQTHADESKIYFHVGCSTQSSDCVEFQFLSGDGKTVLAKKEPEMTLSQAEIAEAEMVTGEYGEEKIQLSFAKGTAEEFGRVTGTNVGKELVIIANGKAVTAPTVREAITSGSIVLKSEYFDGLPWLKKMAEAKNESRKNWRQFSIISFVVFGLFLIGGSIYFAFFRKRSST